MSSLKSQDKAQNRISAAEAVAGLKESGQLQIEPQSGNVYWVEFVPELRRNILTARFNGESVPLTPEGYSVRSRVHEYGGLSWCLTCSESWVFVNEADQQLYRQHHSSLLPEKLTDLDYSRFGNPTYDASRQRIICVEEQHLDGNVINRLVSVCLESGKLSVLHEGRDFYSDIALSKEGDKLAFISWNHPNQPWLNTLVSELLLSSDSIVLKSRDLESKGSNQQPLYTDQGELRVLSDKDGWWNIYSWSEYKKQLERLVILEKDCGISPWQFGGCHHCTDGNKHWFITIDKAEMTLNYYLENETATSVKLPASFFKSIQVSNGRLYCIQSSESLPTHFAEYDLSTCRSPSPRANKPKHLTIPVEHERTYGLFYQPETVETPPPVVIFFHGGPTSCAYPIFNPLIEYWLQRGFAVLNLNYRGSSGYGRDYRMKLHKNWGEVDVEDAIAARSYLVNQQLAHPDQVFVRGSSAGGFTALLCLINEPAFAGAGCLYGVTDPISLRRATHKFESCYLDWLIGDPDESMESYLQRSALKRAAEIHSPVIFFQGEKDPVVVPQQTRDMVEQLEFQITVESHYYPDEAHGFRSAETLADVLNKEYLFYQKVIDGSAG